MPIVVPAVVIAMSWIAAYRTRASIRIPAFVFVAFLVQNLYMVLTRSVPFWSLFVWTLFFTAMSGLTVWIASRQQPNRPAKR